MIFQPVFCNMAINLLRAGTRLIVWNRSSEKCEPLRALGAAVAANVEEVFEQVAIVIVMLFDRVAIHDVLRRGAEPCERNHPAKRSLG